MCPVNYENPCYTFQTSILRSILHRFTVDVQTPTYIPKARLIQACVTQKQSLSVLIQQQSLSVLLQKQQITGAKDRSKQLCAKMRSGESPVQQLPPMRSGQSAKELPRRLNFIFQVILLHKPEKLFIKQMQITHNST